MLNPSQSRNDPEVKSLELGVPRQGTIVTPNQVDWYSHKLAARTVAKVTFTSPAPGEIVGLMYLGIGGNPDEPVTSTLPIGSSVHHGEGANQNIQAGASDLGILISISGHNGATSKGTYMLRIDAVR